MKEDMYSSAAPVIQQLQSHVGELLGRPADQVQPDCPLHELGLDSMGFVDLLVFIEKKFKLSLMTSGLSQEDFASLSVLGRRIVSAPKT